MTIGSRLKMIRKSNNLKLQQVGDIFDVTAQTLSRYENGVRTPDNDFLEAFGKHFKLSGNWLLYGESPIYLADDRDKDVHEQYGQHHALGIGGIDHPNEHDKEADEESIDVAARIRSRGCHGVGRHEHHPKRPATENEVPVERHVEEEVGLGADRVQ